MLSEPAMRKVELVQLVSLLDAVQVSVGLPLVAGVGQLQVNVPSAEALLARSGRSWIMLSRWTAVLSPTTPVLALAGMESCGTQCRADYRTDAVAGLPGVGDVKLIFVARARPGFRYPAKRNASAGSRYATSTSFVRPASALEGATDGGEATRKQPGSAIPSILVGRRVIDAIGESISIVRRLPSRSNSSSSVFGWWLQLHLVDARRLP
ncbi:MAG: hypothetical protein IPK39_16565 [Sulfuritalea sp.]|nr:hypothetical protein [Sulfuritalea sp.]